MSKTDIAKFLSKVKQEKADKMKLRNDKLLTIPVTCPYCRSTTNLFCIINQHMKTKRCLKFKKLFYEDQAMQVTPTSEFKVLSSITDTIREHLNEPNT